ncbi:outer membrane protein assembly factor BamE [Paenalcaligenes niemegkensis]|uniref:outer membrane protein assembly factor BamE n=1 Tax=Paenalcaligenes niemegkensis TaxID=2895469 RepID=UPI001EE7ED60|nr:outer membrane protein assembly factor BamE [Paenalcaligenes niemegkensis]MCQ9617010.1 outer membrane protein assembly factor BamE [Paenalcaligenes niemegkensis]
MKAKKLTPVLRTGIAVCLTAVLLSACGTGKWGFPYKADVQQGNWITTEDVNRLQPGMTREQVRYVLGTPTLQDIFHTDRWEYPYYNKPGYGDEELRLFTVWFEGDTLVRWEGSEQPERQPFQKADTGSVDARAQSGAESSTGQTLPIDTGTALPINQPATSPEPSGTVDGSHRPEPLR